MIYAFWCYTLFTMACALSPNFAALCVFRFLTGISASAPIVVTGGLYADIYDDPVTRGRAMATLMASTTFGPSAIAPLISGFLGPLNWKLPFWTAMAIAGATMPALLLFMPGGFSNSYKPMPSDCMQKHTHLYCYRSELECCERPISVNNI